ncbi:MAG: methyltransferase domain-containing protein [Aquificae bacterium]|nr:methyltransferase domain-containing protein [Aquificota bacterium]
MKNLVRLSFSRFAESYNKEAVLQKEAAEVLGDFAGFIDGTGIDLGCGTGFLYDFLENKNVIGIDISKEMILFYKEKNPKAVIADIEKLPFKEKSFDFAVSNFSLHWTDIEKSFLETYRVLKEKGVFVFNIPFYGSLDIIEEILGVETFDFLCVPEILKSLKKAGFGIEDFFFEDFVLSFKDGYSLLSHLHKTGVAVNIKKTSLKEKREIVQKFKSYKKEAVLKYRLLFVKAYKP